MSDRKQQFSSDFQADAALARAIVPQNAPNCPTGDAGATESPSQFQQDPHGSEPRDGLSPKQCVALEHLLAGRGYGAAAQAAGIDRKTLYRWRRHDDRFIAELAARREEQWEGIGDMMRALLVPSLAVLAQDLSADYDLTRYRAATALLRLAQVRDAVPVKRPRGEEVEDE